MKPPQVAFDKQVPEGVESDPRVIAFVLPLLETVGIDFDLPDAATLIIKVVYSYAFALDFFSALRSQRPDFVYWLAVDSGIQSLPLPFNRDMFQSINEDLSQDLS
ncbi:hypothetical protein BGZ54_010477 [Gamsiella multidivaricata]|nr:hypothetical protein BGZ54_010477 [Gamsiella multidivaricata]